MSREEDANRDATVSDTIEEVRSVRYPDVDRHLVLEILRLHAEGMMPENVDRQVDEAIVAQTTADS